MSFDPTLPTRLDEIRLALGDTSGDPATEILTDATYTALLNAYPDDWRQAAVLIGSATLAAMETEVKSYTATGDFSVTYRDPSRIEAQIAEWQAAIGSAGLGMVVTVTSDYLTGDDELEAAAWPHLS